MPAVSQFPIGDLLSQISKCEKMENNGGDASNRSLVLVVVGLVVTLVALFLAITSYYQRWPFNHPAPSSIPSSLVKACPHSLHFIVNHANIFSASQSITASSQSSPSEPLNHHSARRFGPGQSSLYF